MKKFLSFLVPAMILVSCGGGSKNTSDSENKINVEDTSAPTETVQKEEPQEEENITEQTTQSDTQEISLSDLIKKGEYGLTFKSNLSKILSNLGFNMVNKKSVKVDVGTEGDTGKGEKCKYEKNGTVITVTLVKESGYGEDPSVEITFPTKELANNFVKEGKTFGFKKGYSPNTYIPSDDMSILSMTQDGKKVSLYLAP